MTHARHAPVPGVLGRALSRIYAWEVARRNRRFDAGTGVITLDRPVVSVGNLSVGGTGKTPVVSMLVRWLREDGFTPCVAMRGYVPRGGAGPSDEAMMYRSEFPDLPLAVGADRVSALIDLFADESGRTVDCVVLDDGFQHRRIARDLDIVLLDATRDPFLDRCLPAGWLREPVESLGRAHAVMITHAERVSTSELHAIADRARSFLSANAVLCTAEHQWSDARTGDMHGSDHSLPLEWLRGRRVLACCAIGNPAAFLDAARDTTGVALAGEVVLRDHDPYQADTVARVIDAARSASADAIITTEKDWVKLRLVRPDQWPCPVVRPVLSLRLLEGETALRDRLRGAIRAHASAQH